jgi:hypothetical protein
MYITKDYVFLHNFKTAGNYILKSIENSKINIKYIKYHCSLRYLPERFSNMKIIGVIRNPWDWYVSYYHYCMGVNNANLVGEEAFIKASNNFSNDFQTTLLNMLDDNYINIFFNSKKMCPEYCGLYGAFNKWFFIDYDNIEFIRFENLENELIKLGIKPLKNKINSSKREEYKNYYNNETKQRVLEKESEIIKKFNYRF